MTIWASMGSRWIEGGSDNKLRRGVAMVVAAAVLTSAAMALAEGVVTGKASYQPGEMVTITGEGWRPQEAVSLTLGNTSGSSSQLKAEVTASALGSFTHEDFLTDGASAGQILTLTARGAGGGEAMLAFRNGPAPGSLKCSGLSISDAAHYGLLPGQKAICTIDAASDLSTAQQRGVAPVEVMVRSRIFGNETATVLSVSGSTITFQYTAPAAASGSATVSYGPINGCDPLSGKCATVPTPGNDANSMLLSASSSPAGFVYLAEGAAPSLLPNLEVAATPQNGAFSQDSALSYTVVVSNPAAVGSGSASNVMLTDELPGYGGLLWLAVTTTQGSCSIADNRVNCSLGDIQAQGSVTVKVTSTATTPAAACQYQPNPKAVATADGGLIMTASGALTCTPLPQLKVEKSPDNGVFTQGGQAAFTILG